MPEKKRRMKRRSADGGLATRIIDAIEDLFHAYALHVRDWEMSEEDDWGDVHDSLIEIIYDNIA